MKMVLSIALVALLSGCATANPRTRSNGDLSGHWEGFLVRNGLREPVSLELTQASSAWDGRFSARNNFVRVEDVRVTGNNVHFDLPGEGSFDGTVAGDSIAGSVSGDVNASLSLKRFDQGWTPYPMGP
jgi:hypothetical protein